MKELSGFARLSAAASLALAGLFSTAAEAQGFGVFNSCAQPSAYAGKLIKRVLDMTRQHFQPPLPTVYVCRNAWVPNAMAFTRQVGPNQWRHAMHYNPAFMAQLDAARQNEWAQLAVIAHEIGHLVQAHEAIQLGSYAPPQTLAALNYPWGRELYADRHAGFVMATLGAKPEDLAEAQLFMFSPHGSPSHPDTVSRLNAIYNGYTLGGGNAAGLPDPASLATDIMTRMTRW
ncbi:M48 family metalloprotease [Roseovarius aquimarinus]|uniref:Peptidase family M48 n=1 Tax=Roseovarius aquimarinus TaxID=1229156 RepID=A0ABW7I8T2_9RHOB